MESYKMLSFMTLGTKNAPGQAKIDIGGPCSKPFINVTFWGHFLWSRGGKTCFGAEKSDFNGNFVIFSVLERSVWSWEAQKP